ncbi:ScbR family autoregulator-binding transcription factor [Streptomyces sp. TRM 70351]|uniref:ScbR family autoregulator-binding transcription factor n=1 Tax=Streptomyces sp. TRM 70351 TaxID=3116552 RepID=UPI002E7BAE4C|nr:ScbR family autoregulator-binding transcription factor [Streptomyces sp. TRM 70351]MEE1930420.1 ScbR family autoregulator-binding transcription factor [Streptomyces sp. TRM 70351]
MAKQERAIRTRRTVLEAAAKVFGARGYEATTIAEIIEQAGVTKGALYFHFPSKRALADAITSNQTMGVTNVPDGSPLQWVIDLCHSVAYGLQKDPLLQAGTRIAVETLFDDSPMNPFRAWADVLTTSLREGQRQGEVLPHVDPRRTAELIVGSYTGVQLFSMAKTNRADLRERITELWQHLLPAVANPAVIPRLRCEGSDLLHQRVRDEFRARAERARELSAHEGTGAPVSVAAAASADDQG